LLFFRKLPEDGCVLEIADIIIGCVGYLGTARITHRPSQLAMSLS